MSPQTRSSLQTALCVEVVWLVFMSPIWTGWIVGGQPFHAVPFVVITSVLIPLAIFVISLTMRGLPWLFTCLVACAAIPFLGGEVFIASVTDFFAWPLVAVGAAAFLRQRQTRVR